MRKRIYWKVVFLFDGKRLSAYLGERLNSCALEYPPLALVEANPMSAGIFVFTTKQAAENFRNGPMYAYIPCYGIGPARRFKSIVNSVPSYIEEYFYVKSWDKKTPKQPVIEGSVCFNAVQLLE